MRRQQGRAGTPPSPLRASDAERDQIVGELRERFAEGRLSQDSFVRRMDAALRARERSQLTDLLADMPAPRRLADVLTRAIGGVARGVAACWQEAARLATGRWPGTGRPAGRWPALLFPVGPQHWFTIGRDGGCDLVLADLSVSRRHARLERDGSGWLLTDLGSTNGTRLNGWLVSCPVPVRAGDQVSFGTVSFLLTDRS